MVNPAGERIEGQPATPLMPQAGVPRWLLLLVLLLAAFGTRLYGIDGPLLDFHPTRQYRSALIARSFYLDGEPSAPDWQRAVARANREQQGIIEPPIMELLAAAGYHLIGHEALWIARLLASAFWIGGGVFLFVLGERSMGSDAALAATAFYLFAPYTIRASRSFQPESLMVMLMLAAMVLIGHYHAKPTTGRALLAGLVGGLALLVKPVVIYMIAATWLTPFLSKPRRLKATGAGQMGLAGLLTVLPACAYYGYSFVILHRLADQPAIQFVPGFHFRTVYWVGWLTMMGRAIGFMGIVGALLGVALQRNAAAKRSLLAWWGAYVAGGLTFAYATATHDYYQVPFIPVAGLSLAALAVPVMGEVARLYRSRGPRAAVCTCVILFAAIVRARDLRYGIGIYEGFSDAGFVQDAGEIGDAVGHSTHTVMLAQAYGHPLCYHAEIAGAAWPGAASQNAAELRGQPAARASDVWAALAGQADYFVVTDFYEWNQQPELRELLAAYPVVAETPTYLIYQLAGEDEETQHDGSARSDT